MSPADRDRVVPRAALTGGQNLAVEDHTARLPAVDRGTDERVVGDRDRNISRLIQEPADELAELKVVFDDKHVVCGFHSILQPAARSAGPSETASSFRFSRSEAMVALRYSCRMTVSSHEQTGQ
jgi:hypothetical protein